MSQRQVTVTLDDNGMDGSYWIARHAAAVAIKHHEQALRGIERNGGRTRATSNARLTHVDALAHLKEFMDLLVQSRGEAINQSKERIAP